jgi:hypothetical protein
VQWGVSVEAPFYPPRRKGEPFELMIEEHEIAKYVSYDETSPTLLRWVRREETNWANKCFNWKYAGKVAGDSPNKDYARVKIGKQKFTIHRIVHVLCIGPIPKGLNVDHKDRDKHNNHPTNLRLATSSQNAGNRKNYKSKDLPKGVSKAGNKYRATITHNGAQIHLGCHVSPELAQQAYRDKAIKLRGEYAA